MSRATCVVFRRGVPKTHSQHEYQDFEHAFVEAQSRLFARGHTGHIVDFFVGGPHQSVSSHFTSDVLYWRPQSSYVLHLNLVEGTPRTHFLQSSGGSSSSCPFQSWRASGFRSASRGLVTFSAEISHWSPQSRHELHLDRGREQQGLHVRIDSPELTSMLALLGNACSRCSPAGVFSNFTSNLSHLCPQSSYDLLLEQGREQHALLCEGRSQCRMSAHPRWCHAGRSLGAQPCVENS